MLEFILPQPMCEFGKICVGWVFVTYSLFCLILDGGASPGVALGVINNFLKSAFVMCVNLDRDGKANIQCYLQPFKCTCACRLIKDI